MAETNFGSTITISTGRVLPVRLVGEQQSDRSDSEPRKSLPSRRVMRANTSSLEQSAGEHLTDQLLLPLALAGAGSFTAEKINMHARTNMKIISEFLPVRV